LIPLALELTFGADAQRRIDLMPGPAGARQSLDLGRASAVKNASATAASTRAARMCWQVGKPSCERR
jgi:hypothetical protein